MTVNLQIFIFLVVTQHCFICQTVLALIVGSSFSGLLCPVDMPPLVCVFSTSLCQALEDVSGSSCLSPTQILESAISTKNTVSFFCRTALANKIWKVDVLMATSF